MTVTAITLTDPASGVSVPILPADGVAAQVLDVAAPARAVAEDRVNAHGSFDTTRYLSAAAVSLSMLLYPGAAQNAEDFLDQLGVLLNPAMRPYLIVANDQWAGPRQLTVRYESTAKPLSDPTNWPVQVSWTAPGAVWEDATLVTATLNAFVSSSTGLTVTSAGLVTGAGGLVIPATTAASPLLVTNAGNAAAQWKALLYGPCTAPKLASDTTGLTLEFTDDVSLGPGEFAVLDSAARAAYRNNDPSQPLTGALNFATSHWWLLQAGVNTLRYYPEAAGAGSVAQVSYRSAWLA